MAKTNSVIIKKVKKGGHGHHGGAWKVAYADFVTAMMAFFLLLWLLNATTDAQKRGIADYFSPTIATKSLTSGAGGVMGGRTVGQPGSMTENGAVPSVTVELNRTPDDDESEDADTSAKKASDQDSDGGNTGSGSPVSKSASVKNPGGENEKPTDATQLSAEDKADLTKMGVNAADPAKMTDKQFQQLKSMREERQFKDAEEELHQAIQSVPDLKPLAENLVVERTNEGLRIQLVDQEKSAMFPVGSTDPDEAAKKLMGLVAQVIQKMPNKISITGHTDSTPYKGDGYDNYDLSVDRARAMRHTLLAGGTPADRIATVEGKGDTDPILPDNPASPVNRRVSIVVLRDAPAIPTSPKDKTAAPPT